MSAPADVEGAALLELINSLEPVALDELMERAALFSRTDRKYLIPEDELITVIGGLPAGARVLEIDARRVFEYRSVYFDTVESASYLSTARKRRRRFKVRTRSYLDSGVHVLEVKTRGARGMTVKQRLPYDGDGQSLSSDDQTAVGEWVTEVGIHEGLGRLESSLATHYRRMTILMPGGTGRMTIDLGLRWTRPEGVGLAATGLVVAETKTGGGASDVDRLLWSLRHRPRPMSKFGLGLAAMDPALPSNRWRRILRDQLDPLHTNEIRQTDPIPPLSTITQNGLQEVSP